MEAVVPEVWVVQVTPSGEVRIVPLGERLDPLNPTATNCVPDQVTLLRPFVVPEIRVVHATPSGEVRIVPEAPTATNFVPDQATPRSGFSEDCAVQLAPSDDVRISPSPATAVLCPTATNLAPDHATPPSPAVTPVVVEVQAKPSEEVRIVLSLPPATAMNFVPVQITRLSPKPEVCGCGVQVTPSDEVAIMPSPTPTNFVPDHATLLNVFPKDLNVQLIAEAVKSLPAESAPLTATDLVGGAKVYPDLLAVTL
jgi:hypothetical protein